MKILLADDHPSDAFKKTGARNRSDAVLKAVSGL
jgi:hypothetical protein